MVSRPLAPDAYQSGEEQQLGAPVGVYTRHTTLSGKIAFTGVAMLGFFLVIDAILLLVWQTGSALMESSLGFGQLLYLTGSLLAMKWHEDMITPLHPRLSITVYTDGLLYRKGRTIRIVRWENIRTIQRQFKVYRRKSKIIDVRTGYTCELTQGPNLVLSSAIAGVAEVGACIERELTQRLLPDLLADYQAGNSITFFPLTLTRQYIENRKKDIGWTHVSKIEVGPENLIVERDGNKRDTLTVSLAGIPNVCVLEALLEHLREVKGFELVRTAEGEMWDSTSIQVLEKSRKRPQSGKTSWVSTVVLILLLIPGLALETWTVRDGLNYQRLDELPSQTFHVSGPPTLIIKADAIDHLYLLSKENSKQVSVSGWKEVTGIGSLGDIQEHATQQGNTISLNWSMKQTPFLGVGLEEVDLNVFVPTNSNVQIETRTGDLEIGYLKGEINVKTQTARIDIQATLQGHSQLQSTSGQINFCGTLAPQSNDRFQSESGNITITMFSDAAFTLLPSSSLSRISNDYGSDQVGNSPRGNLEAITHSGAISIHSGNPSADAPEFYC